MGRIGLVNCASAWSRREGPNDEGDRFVAILETPPADFALAAVRVQIVKDIKKGR